MEGRPKPRSDGPTDEAKRSRRDGATRGERARRRAPLRPNGAKRRPCRRERLGRGRRGRPASGPTSRPASRWTFGRVRRVASGASRLTSRRRSTLLRGVAFGRAWERSARSDRPGAIGRPAVGTLDVARFRERWASIDGFPRGVARLLCRRRLLVAIVKGGACCCEHRSCVRFGPFVGTRMRVFCAGWPSVSERFVLRFTPVFW